MFSTRLTGIRRAVTFAYSTASDQGRRLPKTLVFHPGHNARLLSTQTPNTGVFVDSKLNRLLQSREVLSVGWYFPLKYCQDSLNRDRWSQLILDLKNTNDPKKQKASLHTLTQILLPLLPSSHGNLAIAAVPSSTKNNQEHGITKLAQFLAQELSVMDATHCLQRVITIPKAATGGTRKKSIHENSLDVEHPEELKGKTILLLDDVVTTGNSISVCTDKLLTAPEIVLVSSLVLGRTYTPQTNIYYNPTPAQLRLLEVLKQEVRSEDLILNQERFEELSNSSRRLKRR